MWVKHKQTGFTIVELLIVIVVIGILAAITIVAYSGIQQRARDTRRLDDVRIIVTALEAYKVLNGFYPASGNGGSFEPSTLDPPNFMSALRASGSFGTATPVDPLNNASNLYSYFRYPAGYYGCDSSRGQYYVLFIKNLESKSGTGNGPGFQCGTQDWVSYGSYVTGGYTN
jgi:general secretion pathway protein G